ncbi:hypothetical protein [Janibacter anophelis]|uniref:hypothetical protein n=1 Tax=Janibacter anophelis TaxID=319054 RepID=UPI000A73646D|nr:hypothetical protein [Janibacter anophelis]
MAEGVHPRAPGGLTWCGSDKVAASGESFSSQYAAERAATNVKMNAGSAVGAAA